MTNYPEKRKLAAVGHSHIIGAAASPRQLGYRQPVLLADRNGTVSMWETFGVRLSDPLPPDSVHREVIGIAVLPRTGDGIAVVQRAGQTATCGYGNRCAAAPRSRLSASSRAACQRRLAAAQQVLREPSVNRCWGR
jgi:hypothetical protein